MLQKFANNQRKYKVTIDNILINFVHTIGDYVINLLRKKTLIVKVTLSI